MTFRAALLCSLVFAAAACRAGEPVADTVPPNELVALERAIAREFNTGDLGKQILDDLLRLQWRLERMRSAAGSARDGQARPLSGSEDAERRLLERLEKSAVSDDRVALRQLALYHTFLGNPEEALAVWRRMGPASVTDLQFLLVSAYLKLALADHNGAQTDVENAVRLIQSRAALILSAPVFCSGIEGYRLYAPLPPKSLAQGENTLLYVEIEGADFHPLPDGDSECRLMFGLKLMNDQNRVIWAEPTYGEYAPAYAGPVRDLHTALAWRVPEDLVPGAYRLQVECVEQSSLRRGESSVAFDVVRREKTAPPEPPKTGDGEKSKLPADFDRVKREAERPFLGMPGAGDGKGRDGDRKFGDREYDIIKQNARLQGGAPGSER